MKVIQLRNTTQWDRCRSCGRSWEEVRHASHGQCRGCKTQEKAIDESIIAVHVDFNLSPHLQSLLLEDETKSKYNYDTSSLTMGSPKPIIHRCDVCGLPKETPFKLFIKGKNCSHPQCKLSKTRQTNLQKYGTMNVCNRVDLVEKRRDSKDQEIVESFAEQGYQVDSIERNDRQIKVNFTCPQKHKHSMSWIAWHIHEQRCGRCFGNVVDIEEVKQSFIDNKCELIEEKYENNLSILRYKCAKGHINETAWKYWQRGCRCPECNNSSTSRGEKEVRDLFSQFGAIKTREVIAPYELDVYFPEHKVAVEYCGLYWHASFHERIGVAYHYNKMKACQEKGVRLITIFEDEWQSKKEMCVSHIKNALSASENKIHARKCEVKEVKKDESAWFFEQNHLQGNSKGNQKTFGLYSNGVLVCALSIGHLSRKHVAKGKRVIEIKRIASKNNCVIVGGISRLFKQVMCYAQSNGYEQIRSYCDLRWGTGNVYKCLGMTLQGATHYTPHFTNGRVRYRNQTFANKKVPDNWFKIYDCGHQTWILNLTQVPPL